MWPFITGPMEMSPSSWTRALQPRRLSTTLPPQANDRRNGTTMRRRSLTTRLVLSHLLATAIALLLLGGTVTALLIYNQRSQVRQTLDAQATLVAAYASALAPSATSLAGLATSIVGRFPHPPGTIVRIFAIDGTLLTEDRSLGEFPSPAAQPYLVSQVPFLPVASTSREYVARPINRGALT